MSFFSQSFAAAMELIWRLDAELLNIVLVSLSVSGLATAAASLVGIPAGFFLAYSRLPGQRIYITLLNTLLALPTVVIGLFVYMFISRRGVFGSLGLLYTQKAIIIGQFILIVPLITALTIAAIAGWMNVTAIPPKHLAPMPGKPRWWCCVKRVLALLQQ